MTTPTPTQAEREAAEDIAKYFGYSVSDKVRERILETLAAHRAGTPPEPAPKGDPAQAHAAELETALTEIFQQTENFELMMFERMNTIRDISSALLARLDAERKAQKGNMP